MSLGIALTLAFVLLTFCLGFFYLKAKLAEARRTREDLSLLLQERRPSLDHNLERWTKEK